MKQIFAMLLVSLAFSIQAETQMFGDAMPETPESVSLGEAIAALEADETSITGKITGKITEVCQKKGCWMVLTDGSDYARVRFKDYGFFVPIDSDGYDAVVLGELTSKTLSAKQANHYEKDAGREANHEGVKREYSIMASSVVLQ